MALEGWLEGMAYACVLGGALGNLADRLLHGCVVDFVHVHYGWVQLPRVQRRRQRQGLRLGSAWCRWISSARRPSRWSRSTRWNPYLGRG